MGHDEDLPDGTWEVAPATSDEKEFEWWWQPPPREQRDISHLFVKRDEEVDWRDGMTLPHMLLLEPDERDALSLGTELVYLSRDHAPTAKDAQRILAERYGKLVLNCSSYRIWAVRRKI